jgi:Arc/MetJ-type ribon-helix-helix transcriptional regulator
MRTTKSNQLRVRLSEEDREALEKLLIKRGRNETLSDLVREALQACAGADASRAPCYLSPDALKQVQAIAKVLNRNESAVLEECVLGIADLINGKGAQQPLIVQEYNLRKGYKP